MVIIAKKEGITKEDMHEDDWTSGNYVEISQKYDKPDFKDLPNIHAVDILSISTKSDPIPLKDVDDNLLEGLTGTYLGHHDLIKTLKEDTVAFTLDKTVTASRWTMLDVNDDFRSAVSDGEMQFHKKTRLGYDQNCIAGSNPA